MVFKLIEDTYIPVSKMIILQKMYIKNHKTKLNFITDEKDLQRPIMLT